MTIDLINEIFFVAVKWLVLSTVVMILVDRSRNNSAKVLHRILCVTLLLVLAQPFWQVFAAQWNIAILPQNYSALLLLDAGTLGFTAWILTGIWFAGFTSLLLHLSWQVLQTHFLVSGGQCIRGREISGDIDKLARSIGMKRTPKFCVSKAIHSPMTMGVISPVILLPENHIHWSRACTQRFILHELAHIRRYDWLCKMIAQMVVAALWFLPPVWLLLKRLEWYAELACDDVVVTQVGGRLAYASDLLSLGEGFSGPVKGQVALVNGTNHYERIAALLDSSRIRVESNRKAWWLAFIFSLIWLPIAGTKLSLKLPLHAQIQPQFIMTKMDFSQPAVHAECKHDQCSEQTLPERIIPTDWSVAQVLPKYAIPVENKPNKTFELTSLNNLSLDFQPNFYPPVHLVRIQNVAPVYPKRALQLNEEGRVRVSFDVFADGHTGNIQVYSGGDQPRLVAAVIAAVEKFRYRPFSSEQAPGPINVTESFEFRITEDAKRKP